MQARARTRLALIRVTEQALDRRPEQTVAFVRARIERSALRRTDRTLVTRVGTDLTLRAIDVHPVVGERLVRWWLQRAAQREIEALECARSGHREGQGRKRPGLPLRPGSRRGHPGD